MATLKPDLRGPLGYVLGVAVFLLALGLTVSNVWMQAHYPFLAYFLAGLITCYAAGLGPSILVAALSAVTAYVTYVPPRLFPEKDVSPLASAAVLFVILIGCCAVLSALLRSRERLEAERERYAQLAESRDLLYRELQHRVSNNIQIVSGLLRLQSQALSDPAAKRALAEASSRIALIARIQRQLQDPSGAPASFQRFAEELLTDALGAAGIIGVAVEVEAGEAPLHVEQATPVSLVMLECVNNALEHAFAPGQEGLVRVALKTEGTRHLLTVSDNGRGIPEGFDAGAGKSLGLKIVRAMAAQVSGDFAIAPLQPGARCTLSFPNIG